MAYASFGYFTDTCDAWYEGIPGVARGIVSNQCNGGLVAEDCKYACCRMPLLSNKTFRDQSKSVLAWQAWNEKRIREALGPLIAKKRGAVSTLPGSESYPFDLMAMAFDQGGDPEAVRDLSYRLAQAVKNFQAIYPGSRWTGEGSFKKEQTDYRLSAKSWNCIWKYKTPVDFPKGAAYQEALKTLGLNENTLKPWLEAASAIINEVPGSADGLFVSTASPPLVTWIGEASPQKPREVVVDPWLQKFLDHFTGKYIRRFKIDLPKKKSPVQASSGGTAASYVKSTTASLPKDDSRTSKASLGIGVGIAAAVAAVGAYLYASRSSK